jgi:hypothetical protein
VRSNNILPILMHSITVMVVLQPPPVMIMSIFTLTEPITVAGFGSWVAKGFALYHFRLECGRILRRVKPVCSVP